MNWSLEKKYYAQLKNGALRGPIRITRIGKIDVAASNGGRYLKDTGKAWFDGKGRLYAPECLLEETPELIKEKKRQDLISSANECADFLSNEYKPDLTGANSIEIMRVISVLRRTKSKLSEL